MLVAAIIIATALTSCMEAPTFSDPSTTDPDQPKEYNILVGLDARFIKVNNVKITPNEKAQPIIEALGTPLEYKEDTSCAFEDKDRTYVYSGFIIQTITLGGVEYIYLVELSSDLVTTDEGAAIGMSIDEIKSIYKGKYKTDDNGHLIVEFENGQLFFFIKNGACTNITYESTTLPNLSIGE